MGKTMKAKVDILKNFSKDSELFERLVTLQNEINVTSDTKVIAVTSIDSDLLAAAFANALGLTYAYNNSKTLIIDANLYNPSLGEIILDGDNPDFVLTEKNSKKTNIGNKVIKLSDNLDAICFDKQVYPGNVFKSEQIQNLINKDTKKYEHFIILTPSIEEHKEIGLLKDVLTSIVLLARKNITKKKDIYDAICFCKVNELPLAKTVVIE